jgi:hypothetical protein
VEGEYRPAALQRLDILAAGKPVDALARLVHKVCRAGQGEGKVGQGRARQGRARQGRGLARVACASSLLGARDCSQWAVGNPCWLCGGVMGLTGRQALLHTGSQSCITTASVLCS